ncbi:hypothetical protein RHMOL_Rhmol09G0021100 [Rhododendron molle]|uniref:Uncharacterized protein n=1 Tax=Rhododendron molle TaxID=49168 RepID=A0ACC0MAQ0_RHOML|nr:hypothetical protein RHMOL_Rhmol09G0021100 [Rhododendron molle]
MVRIHFYGGITGIYTLGLLFLKYGDRFAFNAGNSLNAKVSSIIDAGKCKGPRSRSVVIREIINGTAGNLFPTIDKVDRVIWTLTPNESFSAISA